MLRRISLAKLFFPLGIFLALVFVALLGRQALISWWKINSLVLMQALVSGSLMGGVYSLAAIGLTLIFGVLGIVNFPHGVLMTMGMYVTFVSLKVFGINPYLSILVCIPLLFLIGILIQRFTFQLVMEAPHINQLLLGLGIALFLTNLLLVVFGSDPKSIRTAFTGSRVFVGEVMISLPRLAAFGGGLIGAGVLFFFLKYTDLGKAIRASSEEREGSELVGINVKWVQLITYGLGTACAGTAGSLIMPFLVVDPNAGDTFIIIAFTIVALGGLGNMIGSLIGGIIIGLVEALGAIFLPGSSKLLGVFLIFILILLFRPSGILSSVSKWQR